MKQGCNEIIKIAGIGPFLISQRAYQAIQQFLKRSNEKTSDWYETLEQDLSATRQCLETVREAALIDLMVRNPWYILIWDRIFRHKSKPK